MSHYRTKINGAPDRPRPTGCGANGDLECRIPNPMLSVWKISHNARYPESRQSTGDAHARRSGSNFAATLTASNHSSAPRVLLANTNFPSHFNAICSVQSLPQKQFPSRLPQISTRNPPSHPSRGADRESSRTRGGMRWTQQRRREACSQGGFAVSEQQRADERRFRLRQCFDGLALDTGEAS
jgi:hypothetical protein